MEPKIYSTQEESPSPMPNSLELEAAAMRLKLQQNKEAREKEGIQSASDKLRQLKQQPQQK